MKVLLVRGNPRKNGFTQRITDLFLRGLREADAEVTDVDLATRSLAHCTGCFHCWLVTPGQCVHGDDMGDLLEAVLRADVLVCATPVYYFSMSAGMKTFLERTFPLATQGVVPSARGRSRNSIRHPDRWQGKKFISIVAGALRDPACYRPVNETFELIADSLDLELGGQLTRPECYMLDFPLSKPKTLKRIETAFVQAGREAGSRGRLSPETIAAAALPMAASEEHFRTYSNIYWTHATALGPEGCEPARVSAQATLDVRILMREMLRFFDAKAAARLRAVLQFDFPDQHRHYRLTIDRGHCELAEEQTPAPDLRVICDAHVWASIFTRAADVRDALKTRRLVLEGDKALFTRLDRLFPPPSA